MTAGTTFGSSSRPHILRHPLALLGLLAGVGIPAAATAAEPVVAVEIPDHIRFEAYSDTPDSTITSRKDGLFFFPCQQCHDLMDPDPQIRELDAPHESGLDHGRGRIWCYSCHHMEQRDALVTLLGEPLDFDQAYLVCSGCHAAIGKDWFYGAHGKRVGNWQGDRHVLSCPDCHDPHRPAFQPRKPAPAPKVRAGLEQPQVQWDHAEQRWHQEPDQHE